MTIPLIRMAYYGLTQRPDGSIIDVQGKPFSPSDYSRFKHGDARVMRMYGRLMADEFKDVFIDRSAIVAPFAFMYVPTAAGNMMPFLHDRIGWHRMSSGIPCIERFHVHKEVSPDGHRTDHGYALVSVDERRRILQRSPLCADFSRLAGKTVVLIDDIRITGSSEARLLELLQHSGAKSIVFLYIASMDAEVADLNPGIESTLNQWHVKSLREMAEILSSGEYRFNLRNCKFILEQHGSGELPEFLRSLDDSVLEGLWSAILANSYYFDPGYIEPVGCIERELSERGLVDAFSGPLTKQRHIIIPDTAEAVQRAA